MKNEFTTLFLKYVLKGLFSFRYFRRNIFEPILTKNIEYLSDGILICNNVSIYH